MFGLFIWLVMYVGLFRLWLVFGCSWVCCFLVSIFCGDGFWVVGFGMVVGLLVVGFGCLCVCLVWFVVFVVVLLSVGLFAFDY